MKIAVAMSGGVDSSAAAALLKEQGHELIGFTMQLWNQRRHINVDENGDPLPSRCCSLDDVYDARRVAESLGFPFYVLNLEKDFERDVVEPFIQSYLSGETPIPCVACNSRLKFASLDRMAPRRYSPCCDALHRGHRPVRERSWRSMLGARRPAEPLDAQENSTSQYAANSGQARCRCSGVEDDCGWDVCRFVYPP